MKKRNGFTLIEVGLMIAVVALLASAVVLVIAKRNSTTSSSVNTSTVTGSLTGKADLEKEIKQLNSDSAELKQINTDSSELNKDISDF